MTQPYEKPVLESFDEEEFAHDDVQAACSTLDGKAGCSTLTSNGAKEKQALAS